MLLNKKTYSKLELAKKAIKDLQTQYKETFEKIQSIEYTIDESHPDYNELKRALALTFDDIHNNEFDTAIDNLLDLTSHDKTFCDNVDCDNEIEGFGQIGEVCQACELENSKRKL